MALGSECKGSVAGDAGVRLATHLSPRSLESEPQMFIMSF